MRSLDNAFWIGVKMEFSRTVSFMISKNTSPLLFANNDRTRTALGTPPPLNNAE